MNNATTYDYIKELLNKGAREDGRESLEYRALSIKPGTMPNAEGSAEVNIGFTRVLAGVKVVLGEPMSDRPNEGNLAMSAELLPLAAAHFEPGPPSPDAIELARVVDRGIRAANIVDLPKLFIAEEKVWDVYVDLYVLNYDGNLFDACTMAAITALKSARMPKYENDAVIREGNLGRLPTKGLLSSCTFGSVAGHIILDMNANEESFADARLTIANDETVVRAMQKGLGGAFSPKEISDMLDVTFDKSKEIRNAINKSIGE